MSTEQVAGQRTPARVAEPTPAEEPKTEKAPGATAGGLPAKALAVVVGVALALFAVTVWAGWRYVVRTAEASEREDWDQLLGLIDKVDNLVLFLLGAIFGVAVQHGQTAVASRAAATNEQAAKDQHQTATANQQAAEQNKDAAIDQAGLVKRAEERVQKIAERLRTAGDGDQVLSVDPASLRYAVRVPDQGDTNLWSILDDDPDAQHVVIPRESVSSRSDSLDALAADLDAVVAELRDGRLGSSR